MSPRIVFSDMDDTFLTTDKRITPENLGAVDALAERGIQFVPCTGRPYSAIPAAMLRHPATRYAVSANGAIVTDVAGGGRILHRSLLGPGRALRLYEAVRDLDVTFDVFADGRVYAERERYERLGSFGIDEFTLGMLRDVRTPVDIGVPEVLERATDVERVSVFWHHEDDRDRVRAIVGADPTMQWVSSNARNIEIMDVATSKGAALAWLCGELGIPVADSVAFGDNLNDVSMIEAAGDGVAMGNAADFVRAAADHVAPDNDHSGVGRYLAGLLAGQARSR